MSKQLPRLEVDPETKASYLYVSDGEVANTIELQQNPQVLMDVDYNGKIVGIEVLRD